MVAEWAHERLQIQVAETQRSEVWIPLGAWNDYMVAYLALAVNNKKQLLLSYFNV